MKVHPAIFRPLEAGALLRLTLDGAAPSFTWAWPERGVWAVGLGEAANEVGELAWQGGAPAEMPGPFFGGFAFDEATSWAGWPVEQWRLPRVLAFWSGGRTWAAAFGEGGEQTLARLGEAEPVVEVAAAVRSGGTSRAAWDSLVAEALSAIGRGELKKVVVARTIELEASKPFDVRRVLKSLEARFPSCRAFSFRGAGDEVFVGATPELLGESRDGRFYTEALAGTAAAADGEQLLRSEKDLAEHAAVVDAIGSARIPSPFGGGWPEAGRGGPTEAGSGSAGPSTAASRHLLPWEKGQIGLRRLANVVHLCTPISCAIPDGTDAFAIARALHPTPAVCGTPRAAALDFLRRHESLARGWYAGAVGYQGPNGMHLSVALRCARISGHRATLYIGAGIVTGSTAEAEWLETERKAQAMLTALGAAR